MSQTEQALKDRLKKGSEEIGNTVVWFYARFLSEPSEKETITRVSTILFPRDYAVLSPSKGRHEAAARKWDILLKKDYLRAQLRDIVEAYTNALRLRDDSTPQIIRDKLDNRLDEFYENTANQLARAVQTGFMRDDPPMRMADRLAGIFEREAQDINGYAAYCYQQVGWYQALYNTGGAQGGLFRFVAEETDNTCGRCAALNDRLFTLQQVLEDALLPPLHQHCRCVLIPVAGHGGATAEWGEPGEQPWYEPLLPYWENLKDIPRDAWAMLVAFSQAQRARLQGRGLVGGLDWLSAGMVSGAWEASKERALKLIGDFNLYNLGNWLTLGLFDLGKDALQSEKPLSLGHWLSAFEFGTALFTIYQTVRESIRIRTDTAKGKTNGGQHREEEGERLRQDGNTQRLLDPELLEELANSGVKYTPEDVVMVVKAPDGRLYWLEKGNTEKGLEHILNGHKADFAKKGIQNIPELLYDLLHNSSLTIEKGKNGLFSVCYWNNNRFKIAFGTNGFIVTFYPWDKK